MIIITFELKEAKESHLFYDEAKLILENDKFTEINNNTFIAQDGNVSIIADKLRKSGAYGKGCKVLYYSSSLSKK